MILRLSLNASASRYVVYRRVASKNALVVCRASHSIGLTSLPRRQDTAEGMLRTTLTKVFEISGGSLDHVPPVMYEFEINSTKRPDDRENVYSRVTNMPPILNLNS